MTAQRGGKDAPEEKPNGPRTPYPVEDPGTRDRPGSEPDVLPGPPADLPRM